MSKINHFGISLIKRKFSFEICRDEFALINKKPSLPHFSTLQEIGAYTEDGTEYTDKWCEEYRKICISFFDSKMAYYKSLNKEDFDSTLANFLIINPQFKEIKDLKTCNNMHGYYIMVLDKFKQIYIGKSKNIKKRIQQHWSKTKPFDRTLLPMYNTNSVMSIDCFRPLDTTRILVWKKSLSNGIEKRLIESIPQMFSCNRIGGDVTSVTEALATLHTQD